MTAHFTIAGVMYPLTHLSTTGMNLLLDDKRTREIEGFPIYFDELRRVWPKAENIKVEFVE